ncbi:hypothetical protein D3C86_2170980 [compost metagenome]
MGEGRPPAKLMRPGRSVTLSSSRSTEGFIWSARPDSTQGEVEGVRAFMRFFLEKSV